LAELPPLLTQIENQYDFDRLTPLFRQHQSNLDKFQSKTQPPALKKELTIRTNSHFQRDCLRLPNLDGAHLIRGL
jgi:hypothetical protein